MGTIVVIRHKENAVLMWEGLGGGAIELRPAWFKRQSQACEHMSDVSSSQWELPPVGWMILAVLNEPNGMAGL